MTTTTRRRRLSPLAFITLGCCAAVSTACMGPSEAERLTFQQIAPDHRRYVEADSTLAADAKQRRLDLLQAWGVRVGGAR